MESASMTAAPPSPTHGAARLAPAMLKEYGALTRATMNDYLAAREPRRYLYDLAADYPGRGGKMMRPCLCIATACAFGAPPTDALNTAAAIEMLHTALLIHDDIEDGSEARRGRPTLHHLHGVALALNAGDALALISMRPLLANRDRLGDPTAMRLLDEANQMAAQCAEGQALELGWRHHNALALGAADYLEMVLKKTCWLATIFPLRAGALIGTRAPIDYAAFVRFGFLLGATFQIQDDLLNLVADQRYGKERDGDLWEGKRTLMLIRLLGQAPPAERERLAAILRSGRAGRSAEDVAWMRAQMDRFGCIEYARRYAHGLAGAARHEFGRAFAHLPDSRDKRFIGELVTWVVERT
jgi:geranylgeranyl diphosphate synthase type II